jgi:hypothetical protein
MNPHKTLNYLLASAVPKMGIRADRKSFVFIIGQAVREGE